MILSLIPLLSFMYTKPNCSDRGRGVDQPLPLVYARAANGSLIYIICPLCPAILCPPLPVYLAASKILLQPREQK